LKLKGIGGSPHQRWRMLFNEMIPSESYQFYKC
jgi:hypothetical protein